MKSMENPVATEEITPIPLELISSARSEASGMGRKLVHALEERFGATPQVYTKSLAKRFNYPVMAMEDLRQLYPAFDLFPFSEALRKECLAFRDDTGKILFVFHDPFDLALSAWSEETLPHPFTPCLAHHSDIAAYLSLHEETLRAIDGVLDSTPSRSTDLLAAEDLSLRSINEDTSPTIKLVNSTLYDALQISASDIHFESGQSDMSIRYRIDGVLSGTGIVQGVAASEQIISRIKVMAELDIAEKRIPQDGRFKVSIKGRQVDFRVSIMPSIFGEDAVLRILDKQMLSDKIKGLRLDSLGFDEESKHSLRRLAKEAYGMILVTGPTGSGKTTTLYGTISEINLGQDKIITIEDPVEYQLPGVLQIPVNEKKGLTFAKGLRSILRHDPDKILVGEIRDPETAQIAIQSALTGHLVFTTVHANNVFDVLGRFLHMGVDPYSFVSALNGILAQRLLRLNCPQCAGEIIPEESLLLDSGIDPKDAKDFRFVHGKGCGHCRGTGYKGRKAIAEILLLNDEIRELIVSRKPVHLIKEAAKRNGTRLLREAALELVKNGVTSLQEINRVTLVA